MQINEKSFIIDHGILDDLVAYYAKVYDKQWYFTHSILEMSCIHAFVLNHLSKRVIWSSLRRQNMNIQLQVWTALASN